MQTNVARVLRAIGLLLFVVAVSGCSSEDTGNAKLRVSVSALTSVPNVDHIRVVADMSGQPQQPYVDLTFDGTSWAGTMTHIPAGNSWVFTGTAYDASNTPLYTGHSLPVSIAAQQTVTVLLQLSPVNPPPVFGNHAPHIESIYISNDHPAGGENVDIVVGATDPDTGEQAALTYAWTGDAGGVFTAPSSSTTGWSAAADGHYGLQIKVTDPHSAYDVVTFALDVSTVVEEGAADISITFNEAPQVIDMIASTGHVQQGVAIDVTAHATDDDATGLTYTWDDDCDGGFYPDPTVPSTNSQTQFTPGNTGAAACTVTVTVTDAYGLANTGSLTLTFGADPTPFSFAPKKSYPTTGSGAYSVVAADMNGDGLADMVSIDFSGFVSIFLNHTGNDATTPAFAAPIWIATGGSSESIAVGDLDGDGHPDLVVPSVNGSVTVWKNSGGANPTFTLRSTLTAGGSPIAAAIGDVNGDGYPDLVTSNYTANSINVYLNTATSDPAADLFDTPLVFATGATPLFLVLVDVDHDSRLDVVAPCGGFNGFSVLMNQSVPGNVLFGAHEDYQLPDITQFAGVGDLNGDGYADLVLSQPHLNSIAVILDTVPFGSGSTASYYSVPTGSDPYTIAFGDFNGDGRQDLAVPNFESSTLTIELNALSTVNGVDFTAVTIPVDQYSLCAIAADFNSDGHPDLAVVSEALNNVSVLLNKL